MISTSELYQKINQSFKNLNATNTNTRYTKWCTYKGYCHPDKFIQLSFMENFSSEL